MILQLRRLQAGDEGAFLAAQRAFVDPAFNFALLYHPELPFIEYLERLRQGELSVGLRPGYVPATMLFAFIGKEIAGRISIRHRLNEVLLLHGGHIGFGVVPSYRRQGIATQMLRQVLPISAALGIERALLACTEGNEASRRTIERCGGVFENVYQDPTTGERTLRYWIELRTPAHEPPR